MGSIEESAENALLAWRHDGERAQDPVGRPGESIGRVDSLREHGLDLRSGLLTGSRHHRPLTLYQSISEERQSEEESGDQNRESYKARRRANTARPLAFPARRALGVGDPVRTPLCLPPKHGYLLDQLPFSTRIHPLNDGKDRKKMVHVASQSLNDAAGSERRRRVDCENSEVFQIRDGSSWKAKQDATDSIEISWIASSPFSRRSSCDRFGNGVDDRL
jgi:hypothetical protein